jgi:hypothetical protein
MASSGPTVRLRTSVLVAGVVHHQVEHDADAPFVGLVKQNREVRDAAVARGRPGDR